MPITAEQFAQTLENMARAWEGMPEEERLPKDEEKSFFEDCKQTCEEMIHRWHSGESSHPDREALKDEYSNDDAGIRKLQVDLFQPDIKNDPFVMAADMKLRLVKYTAPSRS
eukprot:gb/GFBE01052838.1/.p1 GENE.gb/GFBE01052838.1/~~gb/GFBE01052838.1/.p1  ORF type:complete len:112 (+),score=29.56 gb/GFBE01052838.1/:1-336(+)